VGPSAANSSLRNRPPAANISRGPGFSLCSLIFFLAILLSAPLSPSQIAPNQIPSKSEAQESAPRADSAPTEKNAAQIELLETTYRFETNGDSRKEVHTRVRINNELGVRQFARLNFDFNRSFQTLEIPLVHITHPSGGSADILPSAITDNPNPAVVDAPAYQDVRVKSVRILGLQPGDLLEYRVVTTTSHHPLAPDFWLDHTFDRTGVVSEEIFELDLPASRKTKIQINPATPASSTAKTGEGDGSRVNYRWGHTSSSGVLPASSPDAGSQTSAASPDIALSTFAHWRTLSKKLSDALTPGAVPINRQDSREEQWKELRMAPNVPPGVSRKAAELTTAANDDAQKNQAIYDFVSTKIATIDLPLGATGFSVRTSDAILSSAYATQEEKFVLFSALAKALGLGGRAVLTGFSDVTASKVPMPSVFKHLVILGRGYWMDPSLEVAPLGMVAPVREEFVFLLDRANHLIPEESNRIDSSVGVWRYPPRRPPFPEFQKVAVDAAISVEGNLTAKVKYSMRDQNELTLRVAFHKTPKEKWKEVAQLLAISDGFRGQIRNVTASDPYATKEPFTVEYEITQPKFVDWTKKPVRVPALLPLPGLPDVSSTTATHSANGGEKKSIDLGTPLEIELNATVQLPEGIASQAPTGTSVERDYATFSSKYSGQGSTLHATRKLRFISREIPAARAADLNAFLHAVQADQTQLFTLQQQVSK
jgi:hypothetical protein